MKSKTSCFNRTIYKKNFTHYWPLWALYLTYLLMLMPVSIWQLATGFYKNYDETMRMYEIVEHAVIMQIQPAPIFAFAAAMALAVFSYLYSSKNANMMHALPVSRLELFVTNYLSGLCFLLIPEVIAFLASVLVCIGNEITCIQYLFMGFVVQAGVSFFAYSMAVFVAMFTGHILAMPVYFFISNYLYVGFLYIISVVVGLISYGVKDSWNPGKSCILSPAYYLGNNLRVRRITRDNSELIEGIQIAGSYLVAIYAVAAVVLVLIAYQLYKRRQIETAGDFISVGIVKPIFRWGVAFCGGILLATAFTSMLSGSHSIDVYLCVVASIIVTGFIFFFMAEMLLCKHFKVFKKKRVMEWAGFTAVAVLFITLFQVDVFGIERKVPKEEEIAAVFVNMDYPMLVETEDIKEVLALHEEVISEKKAYVAIEREKKGYYYTTFRYYLKDGSMFERRYPMPITEAYIEDETTPTSRILAWEREEKNLKSHILGRDYETNDYISGYVNLYDEEQNYLDYVFDQDEIEKIVEAIKRDIEEGNMEKYYLSCLYEENEEGYCNNISLDFFNEKGFYDSWDYYSNYERYLKQVKTGIIDSKVRASDYITFGPECTNVVETMEELGIVNDTWRLLTHEEYDEAAQQ